MIALHLGESAFNVLVKIARPPGFSQLSSPDYYALSLSLSLSKHREKERGREEMIETVNLDLAHG